MNQKKNQGYQNTHRKIKACMQKSIEKKDLSQITVSELCKAAGINRSTFYAHFEDIYDVTSQIQDDMEAELLEMYEKKVYPEASAAIVKEYLIILFEHTARHRRFYRAMLHDMDNPVMKKRMYLLKKQIILPLFHQLSINDAAGDYYFSFAVSGFIAVIRQWINANCPETPGQLADILFEMMPWRSEAALDQNFYFQEIKNSNS